MTVTLTLDKGPGGSKAMTALGECQGHGPGSTKDPLDFLLFELA